MTIIAYYLIYPGSQLNLPADATTGRINSLLALLEGSLTESALSLGLYVDSSAPAPSLDISTISAAATNRALERRGFEQQVKAERSLSSPTTEQHAEIQIEARRRCLKAAFDRGQLPDAYMRRLPFVHAKSFLSSVWMLKSAFFQGRGLPPIAKQSAAADDAVLAALPDLKDVRDSASHADERIQRLARGKPIPPSTQVLSPSIAIGFIVDSLINDNITYTSPDGQHGQVPVTCATFDLCAKISQDFINTLPWSGFQRLTPHL